VLTQTRCTHDLQDGFVLGECEHAEPMTEILQQRAVREVGVTLVTLQQHLQQGITAAVRGALYLINVTHYVMIKVILLKIIFFRSYNKIM